MSGGVLGVAGDILSVAFLCFICSLAIQLYCAFSRRAIRPPTPLPSTIRSPSPPPPQLPAAACKQLYLLRFQRSASCPVVSSIAPPSSPPDKLSSAYHVSCTVAGNVSPLASTVASQAHTADLAKLMQLESGGQEHDVDADNWMCTVPPPRGLLFTIKEEGKDEDATEQANVSSDTSTEGSSMCGSAPAAELVIASATCEQAPANCSATCANAPGVAAGLVSQVSSASSELWSTSTSPALSFLSASSSPFPTSPPPRSSFWVQTSRFSSATN